jgi:hypothetical protein
VKSANTNGTGSLALGRLDVVPKARTEQPDLLAVLGDFDDSRVAEGHRVRVVIRLIAGLEMNGECHGLEPAMKAAPTPSVSTTPRPRSIESAQSAPVPARFSCDPVKSPAAVQQCAYAVLVLVEAGLR